MPDKTTPVGQSDSQRYKFGQAFRDEMTGATGKLTGVAYYVGRCELLLSMPVATDGSWRSGQWINAEHCSPAVEQPRSIGFGSAPPAPGGETMQVERSTPGESGV